MEITIEMMQHKADETIEAIAAIKEQIARAKSKVHETGDYSDADWFHSANRALRHKAQEHQLLLREMAKKREEEKQAKHALNRIQSLTLERSFMRSAKLMLDEGVYIKIMDEAIRHTETNT
jgi:hypothetical protein